jgi:hypothetical protein
MITETIDKSIFRFTYLPDYAGYLLETRLDEFVRVGIRFSREADLPLLKSLAHLSEEQLVILSLDSNRRLLEALKRNDVGELIQENTNNWISDKIGIIQKGDIAAEDLTLAFYLRRKIFAHFLDAYTKNVFLQKFIIAELDQYTTQEELIAYNVYLKIQQEKIAQINEELSTHRELLLEAQEFGAMGSFLIHFVDPEKSIYTPEYRRIFELEGRSTFEEFLQWVHPDDRTSLQATIGASFKTGGKYEVEYRYTKGGHERKIWSRGVIVSDGEKPLVIKGVVKELQ